MQRGKPLTGDPEKARAWQQRSAQRYADRKAARPREQQTRAEPIPRAPAKRKAKRRNDGPWRNECIERYGDQCVSCGDTRHVQMDHMKPRAQGGKSVVENGLPLCGDFSRVTPNGGCHGAKTAGRLRIRWEWLDEGQIAWLAAERWVAWDDKGLPYGEGYKHFEPRTPRLDR